MKKSTVLILTTLLSIQVHGEQALPKPCDNCSIWTDIEYLRWWVKDSPEPVPLVVVEPFAPQLSGALEVPGSTLALGDKEVALGGHSGARASMGGWVNQRFGMEGSYFFLATRSKAKTISSDGGFNAPFLVVPFKDATAGGIESFSPIAVPGSYPGSATLKIKNGMQGAEANFLARMYCQKPIDVALLAGFRWWNFNEELTFKTNSPNDAFSPPIQLGTEDEFKTWNNFYGGQVGLNAEFKLRSFRFQATGKLALGAMDSTLKIKGQIATNEFNGSLQTFPAGYFALPTNEGRFNRTRFAVIPEIDLNCGFRLAKWIDVQIGYTFLYATEVLWAGNTIDETLNSSQSPAVTLEPSTTLVGVKRPKPVFETEGLWAQGLSVGLHFCY